MSNQNYAQSSSQLWVWQKMFINIFICTNDVSYAWFLLQNPPVHSESGLPPLPSAHAQHPSHSVQAAPPACHTASVWWHQEEDCGVSGPGPEDSGRSSSTRKLNSSCPAPLSIFFTLHTQTLESNTAYPITTHSRSGYLSYGLFVTLMLIIL